jgi:voltage-gated potassium channel
MSVKQKIHEFIEHNSFFNITLITLIILNVVATALESVPSINAQNHDLFEYFEAVSVSIFTVEYVLRIWSYHGNRMKYACTVYAAIDLLAILPFYVELFIPGDLVDLRTLRIIRLLRFARVLKIARYSESLQLFGRVLQRSAGALAVSMLAIFIILIISSVLVYYAEHEEWLTEFETIPHALWWGVITLTTVGYGDIYPVTPLGKLLGALMALVSIGLFALPSGIIAAGFMEEIRCRDVICPHCGKKISSHDQPPKVE